MARQLIRITDERFDRRKQEKKEKAFVLLNLVFNKASVFFFAEKYVLILRGVMLQKNGKRKIYISRLNQKKDSKVALVNIY